MAGGAVYLVYDQDLLGPSDKSQATLQKAEEVFPPAVYQFSQYVCEKTGLKIPQVPRAGSEAKAWQKGHVSSGWPSAPRPSSSAWCPLPGGMCCSPCPQEAGWGCRALPPSPGPSPLSSQLPAFPKVNFPIQETWNSGRPRSFCLGVGRRYPRLAPPPLVSGQAFPSPLRI